MLGARDSKLIDRGAISRSRNLSPRPYGHPLVQDKRQIPFRCYKEMYEVTPAIKKLGHFKRLEVF